MTTKTAILLHENDNVVTVLKDIKCGQTLVAGDPSLQIKVLADVPFGHKASVKDIRKGESIFKYGEIIGKSKEDIPKGQHVHTHNVEDIVETLRKLYLRHD